MSDEEDGNEFSKDPQFDIYKDIFYFLRDKFLFSNYGLQQYLSARIRHGVLLGEIRPEFENLNLITEKEKALIVIKIIQTGICLLSNLMMLRMQSFRKHFLIFQQILML